MSGDGGTNYNKWNKITKDLVTEAEEEDTIEQEAAAESLGQTRASYSAAEAAEKAKAKMARKAKEALDKHQERESNATAHLENLFPHDKDADDDTAASTQKHDAIDDATIVVDESMLGEKRVLSLRHNHGPGSIILPSDLTNLPITSEGKTLQVQGIIKVFIHDCHDCTVRLECKIITSVVEISNCSNLTFVVDGHRLSTIQADLCQELRIIFQNGNYFGEKDDKIYHAGVSNMKVVIMSERGTTALEKSMDYLSDGAVPHLNASAEEYQFITHVVDGSLMTERLLRIGNKSVTQRELDDEDQISVTQSNDSSSTDIIHNGLSALEIAGLVQQCITHKGEGNDAFQAGEYGQAVLFYSMAIDKSTGLDQVVLELNDGHNNNKNGTAATSFAERHIVFSNRSACFLKLGHHEKALADAEACIELDPNFVKGLFRKGLALHAMKRFREAIHFLAQAHNIEPKNKQIKQALQFAEVKLTKEMRKRSEG